MTGALQRLGALTQYVGLIGFSVATTVQFLSHGDAESERRMLENGLVWLVGLQGFVFATCISVVRRPDCSSRLRSTRAEICGTSGGTMIGAGRRR